MEDVKCLTCSVDLATSRTRRKLMTPSSGHITCVLLETLEQLVPAGKHVNTAILKNCYVCRFCFSSMEIILKFKDNLEQLSQDLSDKARSAVSFLPLADIESDEEAAVEPGAPPVNAVSVRMINFIIIACINIIRAHTVHRSLLVTMNPKPV